MGLFGWLWGDQATETERYKVILYDSPQHGYDYVILMLEQVCGLPPRAGFNLAQLVDKSGSAVVFAGTLDECEHACHTIREYGPDSSVASSAASMRAEVVRA